MIGGCWWQGMAVLLQGDSGLLTGRGDMLQVYSRFILVARLMVQGLGERRNEGVLDVLAADLHRALLRAFAIAGLARSKKDERSRPSLRCVGYLAFAAPRHVLARQKHHGGLNAGVGKHHRHRVALVPRSRHTTCRPSACPAGITGTCQRWSKCCMARDLLLRDELVGFLQRF